LPGGRLIEEVGAMVAERVGGVFLARATEGYIERQERIAEDPPRWDYHLITGFEGPTALSWFDAQGMRFRWIARPPLRNSATRLGYTLAVADGWLSALLTALERHAGAEIDGSEEWAGLQERTARSHAAQAAPAIGDAMRTARWIRDRGGVGPDPEGEPGQLVPPPEWDIEQFELLLGFVESQDGFRTALAEFA